MIEQLVDWPRTHRPSWDVPFYRPRGCVFAFFPFGLNNLYDRSFNTQPDTIAATPEETLTEQGLAMFLDDTASEYFEFNDSARLRTPSTGVTVMWIGINGGSQSGPDAQDYPRYFGKFVNGGASSPYISYDLANPSGVTGSAVYFGLGSGGDGFKATGTINLTSVNNVPLLLAGRWGHSGTTSACDAFRLDTLARVGSQTTTTFTGPIGYDTSTAVMGANPVTGAYMAQYVLGCYIFDRALTDYELYEYVANPWKDFKTAIYSSFAPPPAGGEEVSAGLRTLSLTGVGL